MDFIDWGRCNDVPIEDDDPDSAVQSTARRALLMRLCQPSVQFHHFIFLQGWENWSEAITWRERVGERYQGPLKP